MKHWIFSFLIVCSSVLSAEAQDLASLREARSFMLLTQVATYPLYACCREAVENELKSFGQITDVFPNGSVDETFYSAISSRYSIKVSTQNWIVEDGDTFKVEIQIALEVLDIKDSNRPIWGQYDTIPFSPNKAILQENLSKAVKALTKQLSVKLGKELTFYIL